MAKSAMKDDFIQGFLSGAEIYGFRGKDFLPFLHLAIPIVNEIFVLSLSVG